MISIIIKCKFIIFIYFGNVLKYYVFLVLGKVIFILDVRGEWRIMFVYLNFDVKFIVGIVFIFWL